MRKSIFFVIALFLPPLLFSQNSVFDSFAAKDPKATMMGEAMTASSDGLYPFWYNPAGFGRKENGRMEYFGLRAWYYSSKRTMDALFSSKKDKASSTPNRISSEGDDELEDKAVLYKQTTSGSPSSMSSTRGILPPELSSQMDLIEQYQQTETDANARNNTMNAVIDDARAKGVLSESDYQELQKDIASGKQIGPNDILSKVDVSNPKNVEIIMGSFKDNATKNASNDAVKNITKQIDPKAFSSGIKSMYNMLDIVGGVNLAIAWSGYGFGAGFFTNLSAITGYNDRNGSFDMKIGVNSTLTGGYAFNALELAGKPGFLSIGFMPRISFLGYLNNGVSMSDLMSNVTGGKTDEALSMITDSIIYYGIAFNLDVGLLYDIGYGLTFGFSIRDLLPYPRYIKESTLANIFSTFWQSDAVSESVLKDAMPYRPNMSFGFQYNPDLGERIESIIDFTVALDYQDLIGSIKDKNFSDHIKFGFQMKLQKMLTLGFGYTDNFFTTGIGLDLKAVDLDFAFSYKKKNHEDVFGFNIALLFKWDYVRKSKNDIKKGKGKL